MPKTLTFTMCDPDGKKHSTRFNFEALEAVDGKSVDASKPLAESDRRTALALKSASFYIPKPIAERAKRIRITIEEVD